MTTIYGNHRQHRFTVANAFAQAEALMKGKTLDEVQIEWPPCPKTNATALHRKKNSQATVRATACSSTA